VVLGLGVRPNTALAREAGLPLGEGSPTGSAPSKPTSIRPGLMARKPAVAAVTAPNDLHR
jgi:hypothetical protein